MPTFTNNGTSNVQFRPISGGLKQIMKPGETCESYDMLHVLFPDVELSDNEPRSDRVMRFINPSFPAGGGDPYDITLTENEVRHASRIMVTAKGANLTLQVAINGKLWRKLDVNAGYPATTITLRQDVATVTLTANTSGQAYVYIDRDYWKEA